MFLLVGSLLVGLCSAFRPSSPLSSVVDSIQLSDSVRPCDNFGKFVCGSKRTQDFVHNLDVLFYVRIQDAIVADTDVIINEFKKVRDEAEKARKLISLGKKEHEITSMKCNLDYDLREMTITETYMEDEHKTAKFDALPPFVQGIAATCFEQKRFYENIDDWVVKYALDDIVETGLDFEFTLKLLESDVNKKSFIEHPGVQKYLQLVYLKYILEKQLHPVGARIEQFKLMFDQIRSKITEEIKSSDWTPHDTKRVIIEQLASLKPVFGVSDDLNRLEFLKKVLLKIQAYFLVHRDIEKPANCSVQHSPDCVLDHYANVINEVYELAATDVHENDYFNFKYPIIENRLFYDNATNTITFYPALLYIPEDLPVGMRFGLLGARFAYEILQTIKDHVKELDGFKEKEKAVKEFSKLFDASDENDSKIEKDGNLVDALQIPVKILSDSHDSPSTNSNGSYSDVEWYFVGLQVRLCSKEGPSYLERFPGFSDAFGCK